MDRTLFAIFARLAVTLSLLSPFSANAVVATLGQPAWNELSQQQQQILAPLAGEWEELKPWRRKKWIGIAQRYPSMKPEEQERIQRRMKDWVKLSPAERDVVREKYKAMNKSSPEHKETIKQKWQEYKELPDDEKQRIKTRAATRQSTRSGAGKPLFPVTAPPRSSLHPLVPPKPVTPSAPTMAAPISTAR